jgi:two-component system, NarL family, nitrate/nitrite response regulator NarL
MSCVSLVIADRSLQVLRGLTRLIGENSDFQIVATCRDGATCIQAIRDLRPNIALVGVFMPKLSGLEIVASAASEHLNTRVVFLTASAEDRNLVTAAAKGGFGVLPNEVGPDYLLHFLRHVAADRRLIPLALVGKDASARETVESSLSILTDRERQIMHLVSEGLSNKVVGNRLGVSEGTIKVHLHHMYQKLAISNRTALAAMAIAHNGKDIPSALSGVASAGHDPVDVIGQHDHAPYPINILAESRHQRRPN